MACFSTEEFSNEEARRVNYITFDEMKVLLTESGPQAHGFSRKSRPGRPVKAEACKHFLRGGVGSLS